MKKNKETRDVPRGTTIWAWFSRCAPMILLSGFTTSALIVIVGIYLVMAAIAFMLVFALLLNIKPFTLFLKRSKEKSKLHYYSIILLLFILNTIIVTLIIYLKSEISGKGLIE